MTTPTTNNTIEDLRVTIKPKHPFAYGDTLTFNLPPETIAEIHQLMLQERIKSGISELEDLDHNPQMFGDWQQVVEDRINELEAQLEKSKP